MIYNVLVGR